MPCARRRCCWAFYCTVISFMGENTADSGHPALLGGAAEIHEAGSAIGMELPEEFSPYKFVFMQAIHGFRMPLFFVVSGFFAAMLWRNGMKKCSSTVPNGFCYRCLRWEL